jgi:hypothetical protein
LALWRSRARAPPTNVVVLNRGSPGLEAGAGRIGRLGTLERPFGQVVDLQSVESHRLIAVMLLDDHHRGRAGVQDLLLKARKERSDRQVDPREGA